MVRILFWAPIVTVLLVWGAFSSDVLGIDWQTIGLRGGISNNRNEENLSSMRVLPPGTCPGQGTWLLTGR